MMGRAYRDPTADAAIGNVTREEKKKQGSRTRKLAERTAGGAKERAAQQRVIGQGIKMHKYDARMGTWKIDTQDEGGRC